MAIAAGKIISRVLLSDWCEFGLANSQTNKFKNLGQAFEKVDQTIIIVWQEF